MLIPIYNFLRPDSANSSWCYIALVCVCSATLQPRKKKMSDFYCRLEEEIPRLRRYARALTRNITQADDLVQDTLTRAIQKEHLWEPGTDLRAWLFTIMHNQSVNQIRRVIRDSATVDLETCSQGLVATTDPTASRQLRELERALGELPEDQRQVILLVGLEGMSYEQAATIMKVPVGTIRSRLSRGRDALRKLMSMEDRRSNRAAEHHVQLTPRAA
jgi:RNA polymerase sigma-70 factor, ECF subfamily